MRARLLPALVLPGLLATVGCVSAFPASTLDGGRGAKALERGATRVQVGGGAGAAPLSVAAGAGAGARIEHQFLDDLAISADVGAGVQAVGFIPTVIPIGSYLGAQWNPFGVQWLALRVRLGGGVDSPTSVPFVESYYYRSDVGAALEPFASLALQVALSYDLSENLALYLVPGIGAKQFLVTSEESSAGAYTDSARTFCSMSSECGVVDTLLFPGATGGLAAQMTENLSFYVAGNVTSGVVLGRRPTVAGGGETPIVALSPTANLQTGLAFTF